MVSALEATAMLTGVNWTLNSTNFGYVQRARTVLGGKISSLRRPRQSPPPDPH